MKILADGKGVVLEHADLYGGAAFRSGALARLPALQEHLCGEAPAIHDTMNALRLLLLSAQASGARELARALIDFLSEVMSAPSLDSEIPNALAISFVQKPELESWVWSMVPDSMRAYIDRAAF